MRRTPSMRLFRDCAADVRCAAAFPDARADFANVLSRFRKGAVETEVRHPATGGPVRVTISHGALATTLMTLLQASSSAWQIPGIIRQAAAGDMTPRSE